jgi:glycerol-3-phosphate cytidylyltransferase-like family protein
MMDVETVRAIDRLESDFRAAMDDLKAEIDDLKAEIEKALTRRVKRLEEVLDAFSQYAYDQGDPQPMPVDMMREILQRQTK